MAKILIIDDDEMFCGLLSSALTLNSNEIFCAHTLEEGLRLASAENVDVVFLDVILPDGNGLDRLAQIRDLPSQPEVIIFTGAGSTDGAETAITSGAWDYIEKPFPLSVIRLHLLRVLEFREEKKKKQQPAALKLEGIIGRSPRMRDCQAALSDVSATDINVLITGETGTGKELFAQAIHRNSRRAEKNFIVVDCAALHESLIESTLFGYAKGAFTGAAKDHEGLIKQGDGGTLFLDEIGELPLSIQPVFLRVLQERRFRPLGHREEIESDFRLIAATNRDLDGMVQAGQFREDLLYRLRAHTIHLPPLREYKEDIAEITRYHVTHICKRSRLDPKKLSPDFLDTLRDYDWPGNVRELVGTLERAVASAMSVPTLFPKHLPNAIRIQRANHSMKRHQLPGNAREPVKPAPAENWPRLKDLRESTYAEVERKYLQELIKFTAGGIDRACAIADISRRRLYELLQKHRIITKEQVRQQTPFPSSATRTISLHK